MSLGESDAGPQLVETVLHSGLQSMTLIAGCKHGANSAAHREPVGTSEVDNLCL